MSKLRLFFLIILIPIIFFECEKNYPVPNVYVNLQINLNSPLYNALNSIGNSIVIPNEGNKGLIITRVDFEKFAAFDATCTYDPNDKWGKVVPDATGVFAKDTVCGSKFSLFYNGSVFVGPATFPLREYVAEYNPNTNSLFIHN